MKKTAITAIILSLMLSIGTTASAQSETSMAETTRPVMTAPSDYVPEPQEELVTEYAAPIGEQGRGSVKNLEYHYYNNGYPEYISYIAAYDKMLTEDDELAICIRAGLTDMSQENKDAILELADSSCYIVFEQASYSYNERQEIYSQLREEFPDCYISFGYETEDIIIVAPENRTEECLEKLAGRFDGLVSVADSEGWLYDAAMCATGERISVPDGGLGVETGGSAVIGGEPAVIIDKTTNYGNILIIAAVAAAVMLIIGAAFLVIRRSRIKLSADGTASAAATLTKRDVMKLISDSAETPSDELKDRII